MKLITKRVLFEGRVQGVGFRYTVKELSKGFDITGTVKNLAEGSVELIITGEPDELEEFIDEITQESAMAHNIKGFSSHEEPLVETMKGFTIAKN